MVGLAALLWCPTDEAGLIAPRNPLGVHRQKELTGRVRGSISHFIVTLECRDQTGGLRHRE